jgi:hypothetical protein
MKTTRLISLVCSLISCAVFRVEAMEASLSSDTFAPSGKTKLATDAGSQLVSELVPHADFQKDGPDKGETLIALSLFASTLGLVVLMKALLRAPEGYEDGHGFHFSRQRERTSPVRHIRRSLAHT